MVNQNNYPMRDWHFEHMQKTIVKYISGISDDATSFQKKMHRKYNGKIGYVRRNIDFDIKHGVTREEVIAFLDKVQNDSSFSDIRKSEGSEERIKELQIEKQ
jgi:ABC-type Mn2+/Zn2+ transport system ATPase subunit